MKILIILVMLLNALTAFGTHHPKVEANHLKMIIRLQKKLEREENRKLKTDLEVAKKYHLKQLDRNYNRTIRKVKYDIIAVQKTYRMYKHLKEVMLGLFETSASYADFLRSLIIEIKLNINDSGHIFGGSMQAAQALVLVILGYVVMGAGIAVAAWLSAVVFTMVFWCASEKCLARKKKAYEFD